MTLAVRPARYLAAALALAGLAACSAPTIQDRACTGLLFDAPGGAVFSSKSHGTTGVSPAEALQITVADRMSRLIAARAGPEPEAVMTMPPAAASRLSAQVVIPTRRTVDIALLAMTTGGQYGSFSSGFLTGWGERETGKRPEFAVVTGASAGGIIAPLVFAGPEFDARLKLNTGIGERDVIRRRSPLELLSASSLFSTAPLQRAVRNAVDDTLVQAIATRWQDGNDLFLGATNLDKGRFDLFDIGAFLSSPTVDPAQKRNCLVGAVLATSAIPALFPPQRINGDLYTDAAVRQSVFLQGVRDGIAESERLLGVDVRVTAYVLVNGDLTVPEAMPKGGLLGVAERTFELVSDEGLRQSLIETADLARQSGWRLRAVRAPEFDALGCGKDGDLFSPCVTNALFDAGRVMALQPTIDWLTGQQLKDLARRY